MGFLQKHHMVMITQNFNIYILEEKIEWENQKRLYITQN